MRGVSVRHNFETAHRLPHLGRDSKCFNLHGHSWNVEITVVAPELDERGMIVEFGDFKRLVRGWIDARLDHGTMLGAEDPLLPVLVNEGCKTYTFPEWPTVEEVAREIAEQTQKILWSVLTAPDTKVLRVTVTETAVNSAMWGEW